MLDINGVEIKVGQTLRTKQPDGGIFKSSPAVTGIVVTNKVGELLIEYLHSSGDFYSHILLYGKINEVITI